MADGGLFDSQDVENHRADGTTRRAHARLTHDFNLGLHPGVQLGAKGPGSSSTRTLPLGCVPFGEKPRSVKHVVGRALP